MQVRIYNVIHSFFKWSYRHNQRKSARYYSFDRKPSSLTAKRFSSVGLFLKNRFGSYDISGIYHWFSFTWLWPCNKPLFIKKNLSRAERLRARKNAYCRKPSFGKYDMPFFKRHVILRLIKLAVVLSVFWFLLESLRGISSF